MADTKPSLDSDLLRTTEAAVLRQRRRSLLLTSLPIIAAVVFVIITSNQIKVLEDERRQRDIQIRELRAQTVEAEAQEAKLQATMVQAGQHLTELIRATTQIEDLIESKQSFLRSLDEARFLIDIRMRFDSVHEALDRLGTIAPQLQAARHWRSWVTVLASGKSPGSLAVTNAMRECLGLSARTAILRTPNGLFALAALGDGTFTTAYRLTVLLQSRGCAPGAYFASTEGWTDTGPTDRRQ